MPKEAKEHTVFIRKTNGRSIWCVYYRDPETGKRLNAISLQKIKRLFNTGKKGKEPIRDRDEATRLAERAFRSDKMQDLVLHKKKTNSVLLVDYVKSVWNYNTSSYIKERIEEGNHIEKNTCEQMYNSFVKYGEPLIGTSITLDNIKEDDGKSISDIRSKIIMLQGISNSQKNKILQALRTALNYAFKKRILKSNYYELLGNTNVVKKDEEKPLSIDDVNSLVTYLNSNTKKDTYDRWKYMVCAVSALTGMREGEVLALRKKNIILKPDEDCAVLEVTNAIKASGEYGSLKENRGNRNLKKYVAIYLSLAEEMIAFCEKNPIYNTIREGEQFIFWDILHNSKPISKDKVKRVIPNAVKYSDISDKERNITYKCFRIFNATYFKNLDDTKLSIAQNQLGHYSSKTTDRFYARESEEGAINRFKLIRMNIVLSKKDLIAS